MFCFPNSVVYLALGNFMEMGCLFGIMSRSTLDTTPLISSVITSHLYLVVRSLTSILWLLLAPATPGDFLINKFELIVWEVYFFFLFNALLNWIYDNGKIKICLIVWAYLLFTDLMELIPNWKLYLNSYQ